MFLLFFILILIISILIYFYYHKESGNNEIFNNWLKINENLNNVLKKNSSSSNSYNIAHINNLNNILLPLRQLSLLELPEKTLNDKYFEIIPKANIDIKEYIEIKINIDGMKYHLCNLNNKNEIIHYFPKGGIFFDMIFLDSYPPVFKRIIIYTKDLLRIKKPYITIHGIPANCPNNEGLIFYVKK